MDAARILVFNAGSSTIKFAVYEATADRTPALTGKGALDLRATPPALKWEANGEATAATLDVTVEDDRHSVIAALLEWLQTHAGEGAFAAAGHRIVHGGQRFTMPELLDGSALKALDALAPLAPLHQPAGLALVRAVMKERPGMAQVACFDTAFHHTQAEAVTTFGIPHALHQEGVRRYGFHGLSYDYIAQMLKKDEPDLARGKVVVAHLGSGASLCALEAGVSRDTSMGFSALDGIPMATRPGALDAGVPLYMQREHGMNVDALEHWLYHDCGLKGVSGISADVRDLVDSDDARAAFTVDWWCWRIAREVCALANTLGGIDALVFTAGIGEHQPVVRAGVVQRLRWLGAELDAQANSSNARDIGAANSRIALRVIATDEEQVIAAAVAKLLPST